MEDDKEIYLCDYYSVPEGNKEDIYFQVQINNVKISLLECWVCRCVRV